MTTRDAAGNGTALLVDDREAARLLSVSRQTLANWRHLSRGPAVVKLNGRTVRYRVADILLYIENATIRRDDP